ncbi:MAG: hypothetical protein V1707_03640 [bacterium]
MESLWTKPIPTGRLLLMDSWQEYVKRWQELSTIPLPLVILVFLFSLGQATLFPTPDLFSWQFIAYTAVYLLVSLVIGILTQVSLMKAVSGVKKEFLELVKEAAFIFWPALAVALIVGIIQLVGFSLLFVPGFIFSIWLAFSLWQVVLNKQTIVGALKASKQLVQDYFWTVFWRYAAFGLFVLLGYIIVGLLVGTLSWLFGQWPVVAGIAVGLVSAVYGLLVMIMSAMYQYRLFMALAAAKGRGVGKDGLEGWKKAVGMIIAVLGVLLVGVWWYGVAVLVGLKTGGLSNLPVSEYLDSKGEVDWNKVPEDMDGNGIVDENDKTTRESLQKLFKGINTVGQ